MDFNVIPDIDENILPVQFSIGFQVGVQTSVGAEFQQKKQGPTIVFGDTLKVDNVVVPFHFKHGPGLMD